MVLQHIVQIGRDPYTHLETKREKKLKVVRHCQKLSKIGEDIPIWIHFRIRQKHIQYILIGFG